MKHHEILEHKADLKIRIIGETKEDLFENALIGMFESAKYKKEEGGRIRREIKVSSQDLPSLLIDFLSEVLYLSEVNHEIYNKIQFKKFSDKNIKGILSGKKLKRIGVQIKGVTYHNLDIKKNEIWQATILFDI